MITANYGWFDRKMVYDICYALDGDLRAYKLIMGTLAAETGIGYIEDKTDMAGIGIAQFDENPFYDVKRRSSKHFKEVKEKLGIDLNKILWEHLQYNPFLSIIFMRLKYKLVPEKIPEDIEDLASYWKKYYNSYLGKGTDEHFLKMYKKYVESL